jgi:hypothetical protein
LARKEQRNNQSKQTQRNVAKEEGGWWWLNLTFVGQDPTMGLFIGSLDLNPFLPPLLGVLAPHIANPFISFFLPQLMVVCFVCFSNQQLVPNKFQICL